MSFPAKPTPGQVARRAADAGTDAQADREVAADETAPQIDATDLLRARRDVRVRALLRKARAYGKRFENTPLRRR